MKKIIVSLFLILSSPVLAQTIDFPSAAGSGSGTVTSTSVISANGISGSVANPTTTPAITLTLGAIAPSSVKIGAGASITSSGVGGALGTGAFATIGNYLPLAGGTMVGNLLFTDGTYDIGATGATRPRSIFLSSSVTAVNHIGGVFYPTADATTAWSIRQANGSTNIVTVDTINKLVGVGKTPTVNSGFAQRMQVKQLTDVYDGFSVEKAGDDSLLGVGYWSNPGAWVIQATLSSTGAYFPIAFYTSSTKQVVIGIDGVVTVNGQMAIPNMTNAATTSSICYNTGTGAITYDGTLGTCTVSALRFKDILGTVKTDDAQDGLGKLRIGVWKYKDKYKNDYDKHIHVGLYADDVAKMDPRCVGYDKNGELQNYEDRCVLAYLVAGQQKLKVDLETRVKTLEAKFQ